MRTAIFIDGAHLSKILESKYSRRYGINLERRWRMAVEATWDQAAQDAPERDNTASDMSECS